MVWYCEDCKKRVDVCAEIRGDAVFSSDQSREDIFRSLAEKRNLNLKCAECDSNRVVWKEVPIRLLIYKGYTVDGKLREFRKMNFGEPFEFIPFDSEHGRELLMEMEEEDVYDRT